MNVTKLNLLQNKKGEVSKTQTLLYVCLSCIFSDNSSAGTQKQVNVSFGEVLVLAYPSMERESCWWSTQVCRFCRSQEKRTESFSSYFLVLCYFWNFNIVGEVWKGPEKKLNNTQAIGGRMSRFLSFSEFKTVSF